MTAHTAKHTQPSAAHETTPPTSPAQTLPIAHSPGPTKAPESGEIGPPVELPELLP